MSKITTIYNTMVTKVGTTLFPTKHRLPNAYAIDLNPNTHLKDGWALKIGGAGTNTNRELCNRSIERIISVTLSRELIALELDPVTKGSSEISLLEDQITLINAFEADTTILGGSFKTLYTTDSGILFVIADDHPFIYIQTDFACEYIEAIT